MSAPSFPWTSLLLVVAVVLFVYAGTRVRRARAEHRARSDERAAALLRAMHQERAQAPSASPDTHAGAPAARPRAVPAPAAPITLTRKPRLLTEPQRLLYLSVRAGLSDHIVMANIRIADMVERPAASAAAPELDARLQALLQERADCVVCDNDLVPLAALVIYERGIEKVPDERVKVDALRELGIKFLRFRADSLPRPAEMRALILG